MMRKAEAVAESIQLDSSYQKNSAWILPAGRTAFVAGAISVIGAIALLAGCEKKNDAVPSPQPMPSATQPQPTGPSGPTSSGPTLAEIAKGGGVAGANIRHAMNVSPTHSLADGGEIIEISIPTGSAAVARFQWIPHDGANVFIDVYSDEAAAQEANRSVENGMLRMGWREQVWKSEIIQTVTMVEKSFRYSVPLISHAMDDGVIAEFGCLSKVSDAPVLLSASIEGRPLQSAKQFGESIIANLCQVSLHDARAALAAIGVGHVGDDVAGAVTKASN